MRILVISQTFWPDNVASSQALSDLVFNLAARNNNVTVITSCHNYENPEIKYPHREIRNNVQILRIRNTGFGKKKPWLRIVDFMSFSILILFRLVLVNAKKTDVILSMTSPPLLPFLGVFMARMKNIRFMFWAMDLQPELSIATGILKKGSPLAWFLQKIIDYTYKNADAIITLDKYMSKHIYDRVGRKTNIYTIPIWPMVNEIFSGPKNSNPFIIQYGLQDKIIIMYAGNHSVVHPIKTLLDTAAILKDDARFLFVHIGFGIRMKEVIDRQLHDHLDNIKILPFQRREKIHYSLGAADIQVVLLGDDVVGLTHPNKIYGAMYIGKPILYIGPERSHVTDILDNCKGNLVVKHGESALLAKKLIEFAEKDPDSRQIIGKSNQIYATTHFNAADILNTMVNEVEKKTC